MYFHCLVLSFLEEEATEKESSEIDTIQLQLKITCSRNPTSSKDSSDPQELYLNHMGRRRPCTFSLPSSLV